MNIVKIGIGILLVLLAFNANGQAYFGAGFGNSSWDITDNGLFELEEETAIRIFGGVREEDLGFEFGLSWAGYDWEGSNNTHNASNLTFSGIWYLPLGESLDVFGKAGLNLDFGVLWQGEPTVALEATNWDNLSAAEQALLGPALEAEQAELQSEISDYKAWPVVSLAFVYNF